MTTEILTPNLEKSHLFSIMYVIVCMYVCIHKFAIAPCLILMQTPVPQSPLI